MVPNCIIRKRIESQLNTHELWIRVELFLIDERKKERKKSVYAEWTEWNNRKFMQFKKFHHAVHGQFTIR